jgi:hypothetical protein
MNAEIAAIARAGRTKRTAELKAVWLQRYDPALSIEANCKVVGTSHSSYFHWIKTDPAFAEEIKQRKVLLMERRVSALEKTSFEAGNGTFITVKNIYDGEGNLKERQEVQQPPSYKHAELMLRSHAPDVYKPDSSGAQVNITITMSHIDGQGEEVSYIDITEDPFKNASDSTGSEAFSGEED